MLTLDDGVTLTVIKDSSGWRFYAWERFKPPGTIGPLFESPKSEDRERCFATENEAAAFFRTNYQGAIAASRRR